MNRGANIQFWNIHNFKERGSCEPRHRTSQGAAMKRSPPDEFLRWIFHGTADHRRIE
jgi:hypothetical protein